MGLKRSRSVSPSSSEEPASPSSRSASTDVKIVHLDAETSSPTQPAVMNCSLPPHAPQNFRTLEDYEVHYQKTHLNRCTECRKNFPDEHFLHLHIAENHDPISAAKRERGDKIYQCLVASCDRPCSTPAKRRLHCIDKHNFPRNYDFFIVNDGIDRRSSMLRPEHRRRRSSTVTSTSGNAGHRRRSSTVNAAPAEGMDVVRDEGLETGEGKSTPTAEEEENEEDTPKSPRAPIKLHGRGGFGRGGGRGRGRGRGRGSGPSTNPPANNPSSSKAPEDSMEGLTSSMSALQFVPHSVRLAKGRGRGG
ncbi:hypothetical protein K491DRAFT_688713 [Lophiostoma macrostomum CBS 122681]|uniref:C2H2-type domain-containing protein n=1 Tax=Lophiostoma macrostomum CBS 122681 TaxID=1314788 RepID=A0A6A6TJA1_9PLEO|nr:hypothetical protein K491DRAFT_688713 [Lophiostoma macrostomum CBS 122681]